MKKQMIKPPRTGKLVQASNRSIPIAYLEPMLDAIEALCEQMDLHSGKEVRYRKKHHSGGFSFEARLHFSFDIEPMLFLSSRETGAVESWLETHSDRALEMYRSLLPIVHMNPTSKKED